MPYEYRRLTPEEREEVLRQRRERGYPLHAPPHPFRQAGRFLLTAANFEHAAIMASSDRRTEFETRLLAALRVDSNDRSNGLPHVGASQGRYAEVYGWVILPNHYHALVGVESLELVSTALKQLHGATSREWNLADEETGKRQVWYKFSDRMIRNDAHFNQALNYIHFNPVKHGYVGDPYEWPWSSLHNYFETRGRDWLREQWAAHPPGDFGKGWDD